eukprot:gene24590-29907_t
MEYYHDPDTPKHVVMSTNHRDLYDFPGSNLEEKELLKGIEVEGFLHLEGGSERGLSSHEHGRWYRGSGNAEGGLMTLHKIRASPPKAELRAEGLHMLWEQKHPQSYGHLYIDNLFPIFVTMLNLQAWRRDMQLVLMADCIKYPGVRRKDADTIKVEK